MMVALSEMGKIASEDDVFPRGHLSLGCSGEDRSLGLQCFEGLLELAGGARFPPALSGSSPQLLSPLGPILDSAA